MKLNLQNQSYKHTNLLSANTELMLQQVIEAAIVVTSNKKKNKGKQKFPFNREGQSCLPLNFHSLKLTVWNLRHLNDPLKQKVRSFILSLNISLICLVETEVK